MGVSFLHAISESRNFGVLMQLIAKRTKQVLMLSIKILQPLQILHCLKTGGPSGDITCCRSGRNADKLGTISYTMLVKAVMIENFKVSTN